MDKEIIIKLLLSGVKEDHDIGMEYLQRYYSDQIFKPGEDIAVLFYSDLNRILETEKFDYDSPSHYKYGKISVLFRAEGNSFLDSSI